MKRVNEYKKLFKVENTINLKDLKKTYRGLVKEWHPDKFQADDDKAQEAELMSRQIIDGYHFLVSISEDTKASNLEAYTATITKEAIDDFKHKSLLLEVTFTDGNTYEYFGVNKNMYQKLINADKQLRFAKRNIFNSYLYRKSKKASVKA